MVLAIQSKIQDNFEKQYFDDLAKTVLSGHPKTEEDSVILDALHLTHHLLESRTRIFATGEPIPSCSYAASLTQDLLTARGACGSYSDVLCELLQCLGFRTRIAQMKVDGHYGGHMVTETYTSKGWVVLDAMFDQFFTTADHRLASFKDVGGNWSYYRLQTKPGYNPAYCYSEVRYTNWNKLPIVLPLCKKTLSLFMGEQRVEELSLRPHFLRKFRTFYYILLFLDLFIFAITFKAFYRSLPSPSFPGALTGLTLSAKEMRSLMDGDGGNYH
jgi:Transglutaminase-like superfamily